MTSYSDITELSGNLNKELLINLSCGLIGVITVYYVYTYFSSQ